MRHQSFSSQWFSRGRSQPGWFSPSSRTSGFETALGAAVAGAGGLALGAALVYMLDPDVGARRRHVVRDKLFRSVRHAGRGAAKTAEYTRDRSRGILAETAARFRRDNADDYVIAERVRSAMGRAVSHPSSIEVASWNGIVTLCGPVLAHELDNLVSTVKGVRGVEHVECLLDVHKQPGDVPGLQGGATRRGQQSAVMQENWAPSTRLCAGLGGGTLLAFALRRPDALGAAAGIVGAGLLARSLTNLPTKRLVGIGAGRRAVDVQKTINVAAPIQTVFDFFADWGNFPLFMSNIREVRAHFSGRSHWVVAGPMGVNVEWDADVTLFVPGEVIAWRSVKGSTVENAGVIRFDTNPDGSTRVDIKLSYNPPGGALGHAVATLFGSDPKSEMDADLARVKTLIETGNPPRDAARPLKEVPASEL